MTHRLRRQAQGLPRADEVSTNAVYVAIEGVQVDEHTFIGRIKTGGLMQVTHDPRRTESSKELDDDPALREAARVRRRRGCAPTGGLKDASALPLPTPRG